MGLFSLQAAFQEGRARQRRRDSARARATFGLVANVVSFFGEAAEAFCGGARQLNRARRVGYSSYLCSPLRIKTHANRQVTFAE